MQMRSISWLSRPLTAPAADTAPATDPALGALPVWKLEDLYPSPTSETFTSDMAKAEKLCLAFEERWKGKLEEAAKATGDNGLGAALKEFEALDDLLG